MSNKKVIVVVPTWGSPYVASDKDPEELKDRQEVVGGYYQCIESKNMIVHPLFKAENPRWNAIDVLRSKLKSNQYEIICNENGIMEDTPNMALFFKGLNQVAPIFGNVGIVVKKKYLEGIELPYKKFNEPEESDEE